MAEFVLKNNFFEFNNQIKPWISGTAISTKCAALAYACVFMDKMKVKFLETQRHKEINHSGGLNVLTIFSWFEHKKTESIFRRS